MKYIQQLSQQVPYISSIKSTGTLAKTISQAQYSSMWIRAQNIDGNF